MVKKSYTNDLLCLFCITYTSSGWREIVHRIDGKDLNCEIYKMKFQLSRHFPPIKGSSMFRTTIKYALRGILGWSELLGQIYGWFPSVHLLGLRNDIWANKVCCCYCWRTMKLKLAGITLKEPQNSTETQEAHNRE